MRKLFAELLYKEMAINPGIYLLLADLGYGVFDRIRLDFPDRVIDVGASEQLLMGIAIGLAQNGYNVPVVYSITPFLLYRPFEMIRNYINEESAKVVLVGGGRDKDYGHLGFSHWACEDKKVMSIFPNIVSFWPESNEQIEESFKSSIYSNSPSYINLRK